MAFVYEIIKDAFREANILAITQTPSLDEQNEALRLLNRYIKSILGNEAGDKLQSFAIGTGNIATVGPLPIYTFTQPNYTPLNARIMANITGPLTLNLHPNPQDGSRFGVVDATGNFSTYNLTLVGNGRLIDNVLTATLSTNSLKKEWFYRADLGSWMTVTDLTLTDIFPFPEEFEDLFVLSLATRINPRNGAVMDDQTLMNFKRQRSLFKARYSQTLEQPSEDALVRLTGTRLNRQFSGTDNAH